MDLNTYDELFLAQKMIALSNSYLVTDTNNSVLLNSNQKLFKLKEDFRFYTDPEKKNEYLKIVAQNIIDFSAKYNVIDSVTNTTIGIIKRAGFNSLIRGKWLIMNPSEEILAEVQEDSLFLALLRRFVDFVTLIVPVKFAVSKGDVHFGTIHKKRTLIRDRYYMDFRTDPSKAIDRRLVVALSVLLDSINRQ